MSGEHKPLIIRISKPIRNTLQGEYYFIVLISPLLKSEKKIFGYDEEQAEVLAVNFVKDLLVDRIVLDGNGNNVNPINLFNEPP